MHQIKHVSHQWRRSRSVDHDAVCICFTEILRPYERPFDETWSGESARFHIPCVHQWVHPVSLCHRAHVRVSHGIKAIVTTKISSIVQKVGASRRSGQDRWKWIAGLSRLFVKGDTKESRWRYFPKDLRRKTSGWTEEESLRGIWRKIRTLIRMAGWISFILIAIASMIAIAESRVVPANNKPSKQALKINFYFGNYVELIFWNI